MAETSIPSLISLQIPLNSTMDSKIILVQDSDVQRRTYICRGLMLNGYKVLEAINSQHAESICHQRGCEVDLIIANSESEPDSEWRRLCDRAQLLALPALASGSSPRKPGVQETFSLEQLLLRVGSMLSREPGRAKVLVVDNDLL